MNAVPEVAVALLPELVRVPSVSGAEEVLAALVLDWLAARGIPAEPCGGGVLARVEKGPGPALMLASHLDTVPPGEAWSTDPWTGKWHGDRLTGLGANDAKAAVAAMLAATAEFARSGGGGTLVLALTAREETDNAGMAAALEACGGFDAAVVGEPTGLEVVRAQAGLAVLAARWRGRGCHAAHAARVAHENALLAAARDLAGLPPWLELPGEHPLLGRSRIVPVRMHAGERNNVVPDTAEAVFDARLAPPHDARAAAARLREALPGAAQIEIRSERLQPAETPAAHPLVLAALACAGRRDAVGSSTLSDMALLPAGLPAVKLGPGRTERSHTPDEFVLRAEVEAGAACYAALIPAALEALAAVTS